MTAAAILAQLAEEGRPMTAGALAAALAVDDLPAGALLQLARRGHVLQLATGKMTKRGPSGPVLWEITEAGRLEAAGGAQLQMDGAPQRPPCHAQPALF